MANFGKQLLGEPSPGTPPSWYHTQVARPDTRLPEFVVFPDDEARNREENYVDNRHMLPKPDPTASSQKLLKHPRRPNWADDLSTKSQDAEAARLWTNHFVMSFSPELKLFEYSIQNHPGKESAQMKKARVQEVIRNTPNLCNSEDSFLTDYKSNIVAWRDHGIDGMGKTINLDVGTYKKKVEDGATANDGKAKGEKGKAREGNAKDGKGKVPKAKRPMMRRERTKTPTSKILDSS